MSDLTRHLNPLDSANEVKEKTTINGLMDTSSLTKTTLLPEYYIVDRPAPVDRKNLPISDKELRSIIEELKSDDVQKILHRFNPEDIKHYERDTHSWGQLVQYHIKKFTCKIKPTTAITPEGNSLLELALQHGSIKVLTELLDKFLDVRETVTYAPFRKKTYPYRPDIAATWDNLLFEKSAQEQRESFQKLLSHDLRISDDLGPILRSKNPHRIKRQIKQLHNITHDLSQGFHSCLTSAEFAAFEIALTGIVNLRQNTESDVQLRNRALSEAFLALSRIPSASNNYQLGNIHANFEASLPKGSNDICDWITQQISIIAKASNGLANLIIDKTSVAPQFVFQCLDGIKFNESEQGKGKYYRLQYTILDDIPLSSCLGIKHKQTGLGLAAYAIRKGNPDFAVKLITAGVISDNLETDLSQCLTQALEYTGRDREFIIPLVERLLALRAHPSVPSDRPTLNSDYQLPYVIVNQTPLQVAKEMFMNEKVVALLEAHIARKLTQNLPLVRYKIF